MWFISIEEYSNPSIECTCISVNLHYCSAHVQATVRSRLLEFQEENSALQSKLTSLEVVSHGATEQEKVLGNSLMTPFPKFCSHLICIVQYTVGTHLTATSLIWPPCYYGHLFFGPAKSHLISCIKTPLIRPQ